MDNSGIWWSVLAGFVAGLILMIGHYLIPHLRRGRKLHNVYLYIYGTTTINGCYTAWLLLVQPALLPALAGLWIVTVLAGGANIVAHVLDALVPWPGPTSASWRRGVKATDAEAIEDIMALRLRLEREAQIARLRITGYRDAGALYAMDQIIEIAGQMKQRLSRWHQQARRRTRS